MSPFSLQGFLTSLLPVRTSSKIRPAANVGFGKELVGELFDADVFAGARRVNEFMEQEIVKCPGQYFWAQPRFKTRPQGEPSVY